MLAAGKQLHHVDKTPEKNCKFHQIETIHLYSALILYMGTMKMRETLPLIMIAAIPLILIGIANVAIQGLMVIVH